MFPIYVCYDSGVRMSERIAIEQGLKELQPIIGTQIVNYGTNQWKYGRFKSADEIVRSLPRNERGQIDATRVLDIVSEVSGCWIETGAVVMITSQDLYAEGLSWCFGLARPSTRITVQSIARYRGLCEAEASACIRRTLKHELGHIFGCAGDLRRSHTIEKLGSHCTNPGCTMRQSMSLDELRTVIREENPQRCYCHQCMEDLRRFQGAINFRESLVVMPFGRTTGYVRAPRGRRPA